MAKIFKNYNTLTEYESDTNLIMLYASLKMVM